MTSLLRWIGLSLRESLVTTGSWCLQRFLGPNLFASFFKPPEDNGIVEDQVMDREAEEAEFEKYNPLVHTVKGQELLTRNFLKKYLAFAKTVECNLIDESSNYLTKKWTELRTKDFEYAKNKGASRVLPVTVRTLESLIRLATSHARLRLSNIVELSDCDAAFNLLSKTLFDDDREEA
jgi:DNA replication licensing factor MCM3